MEDFRSKSYGDGRMQIQSYRGGGGGGGGGVGGFGFGGANASGGGIGSMQDLRSYSANYASSSSSAATTTGGQQGQMGNNDVYMKKGKSTNGSVSKSWSFNDPELQRKKRVASYKVYSVEGKVKGSFKKSFRWLKDRYTRVVHGWR